MFWIAWLKPIYLLLVTKYWGVESFVFDLEGKILSAITILPILVADQYSHHEFILGGGGGIEVKPIIAKYSLWSEFQKGSSLSCAYAEGEDYCDDGDE